MLGVPVGGALSYFLSGPVAQAYGWRVAMVLAAAPALLIVPMLAFLHEPERGASELQRPVVQADDAKPSMFTVLRIPTLWWIIASGVFVNFNMYAMGTFPTRVPEPHSWFHAGTIGILDGRGLSRGRRLRRAAGGLVGRSRHSLAQGWPTAVRGGDYRAVAPRLHSAVFCCLRDPRLP